MSERKKGNFSFKSFLTISSHFTQTSEFHRCECRVVNAISPVGECSAGRPLYEPLDASRRRYHSRHRRSARCSSSRARMQTRRSTSGCARGGRSWRRRCGSTERRRQCRRRGSSGRTASRPGRSGCRSRASTGCTYRRRRGAATRRRWRSSFRGRRTSTAGARAASGVGRPLIGCGGALDQHHPHQAVAMGGQGHGAAR